MSEALQKSGALDMEKKLPKIAKEVTNISSRPSREVLQPLRTMLEDLEKGLPPATSGEVLSSRVRW